MRRLYRIARQRFFSDLSGAGSAKYGGRWNPKGTYVLYTSANPSLAMLEWLAHVRDSDMDDVYVMATLLVPEGAFKRLKVSSLPAHWRHNPAPLSLQQFGAALVNDDSFLGLEVPSVLMPLDYNVVLNTRHPLFAGIKIESAERLEPDERLLK